MENKITITFCDGQEREYAKATTLLEISRDVQAQYKTPVVIAEVDNEIKDLGFPVCEDAVVKYFDLTTGLGMKAYERSLTFVLITAVNELFPGGRITIEHSLGKGLYCELYLEREVASEDIERLEQYVKQIVAEDRPIVRKSMHREDAIKLFEAVGQAEKVKLLKQLDREWVVIYYCGDTYDYLFGKMVPSTGYLKLFNLIHYQPGFILSLPTKEHPERVEQFVDQPKLAKVFLEAEQWGEIMRCGYVATLNEYVQEGEASDIVRVAEALHEKKIAQVADFILDNINDVRVILIAGPSSSGKTTFAQRLSIQLRVNGVRPIPVSLDDYFVDREFTPRDEDGDYDFEAIEAIDLELFNEHLVQMLNGEEVKVPTYNFMNGRREYRGHTIRLTEGQPLIIEGIHGLNERLTGKIPKSQKIKVYISALTQLAIDNHNRIPTTDTRLIRRIVRDSQFRSHDALRTLQIWPSVRRGEERNIFPFQEDADIMFNSALIYELSVLRNYAQPLLEKITPDNHEYAEAKRLLEFLVHFQPIGCDEIPFNSILREFIGKSCFYK